MDEPVSPEEHASRDVLSCLGNTTGDLGSSADLALSHFRRTKPRRVPLPSTAVPGSITVKFEIGSAYGSIVKQVYSRLIIGRFDPARGAAPDIDLTPYGAYQAGISRQHAMLRREEDRLIIVDLGSRNGTFVNGIRIHAQEAVPICSGDDIRLGRILLKLYIE